MSAFTCFTRLTALSAALFLAGCGAPDADHAPDETDGHATEATEFERGPHRGRMLRDGDVAVEMTIFEDGVDPEFHVYAFKDGKPLDPKSVRLEVALTRLGGRVDRFSFSPVEDYLRGGDVVSEPHSFDVKVNARIDGKPHEWRYESYEGRTTISDAAAKAGGVSIATAGPAILGETLDMAGRVEITPEGRSEVRAWYPGRILALDVRLGDRVRKGQILARIESSHSLQSYAIPSPMSGTVIEKHANRGDMSGAEPLLVIADTANLHAEYFVYPRDAERLRVGQPAIVKSIAGTARLQSSIEAILPVADPATQAMVAHVHLPATAARDFRPGMGVEGTFTVGSTRVPLAVRTSAIQRFRDFEVVYAKVGNSYEVRMLEIGRRTAEWTEILGGLEPGTVYVSDGAFLIRADIEKAGASHDH